MASGDILFASNPFRCLIAGYPGSGKTGCLAALANAGFKLRVLSFDKRANMAPLLMFTEPDKRKNIDVLFFEDPLTVEDRYIGVLGIPNAFAGALKAMDRWKYKEGETEIDLGRSKEWGRDTVVVLDNLTSMGDAAMRRARAIRNKTPVNTTDDTWGLAMNEQAAFIEKMAANANNFHLVINAHMKMVGPKGERSGDTELQKLVKEQEAELISTRLYPSALGRALPPEICRHLPTVLRAERRVDRAGKEKRVLLTVSGPEFDTKVPAIGLAAELPIETGLLTVLEAVSGKAEEMIGGNSGNAVSAA